ncbi:MAG: tRNA preQ1(34) S-adenosylmethionine ribosyltransferase-isomerase QueA [Desulfuromonadaceae bacterium]|nr:tRNA preQ1(34) S-adenosylmethionine ribosyltransferase-isomerase QueA [Desulfuromonadaceae bacterium]
MHLNDFDFDLPEELIAQEPLAERTGSRLMVLDRATGDLTIGGFSDIVDHFSSGDVLVINDTRVIPARLLGRKESGGKVEVLLVRRLAGDDETWICLTKASKGPRVGTRLLLGDSLIGIVVEGGQDPYKHIQFACKGDFLQLIEQIGRMPLPPYIRRDDSQLDKERYQTVFAQNAGAVAAPTAGLHFTPEILEQLRNKGVEIHPLTLHVGIGTFLPVRVDNIREHRMHEERFTVPIATAEAVNQARAEGRRVFALGTTSTRTLEYAVDDQGLLQAGSGSCDLFIYPGYRFHTVDAILTNFHLPRSTLLMLVSAFASRESVLAAYHRAVVEGFRFFSYGDCMLIL